GILVDAPCSGIGTWQRNPHARWTTTVEDVLELAEVQKDLLTNVAASVKPGGRLIYSVCTLTTKEPRDVVAGFSQSHSEFEPMELVLAQVDQGRNQVIPPGTLTLGPADLGGNGMFIAGWRRKLNPSH